MRPAVIEVIPAGNRWTYRFVCDAGRTLVYTAETWADDLECFLAAKTYRLQFWMLAHEIDIGVEGI